MGHTPRALHPILRPAAVCLALAALCQALSCHRARVPERPAKPTPSVAKPAQITPAPAAVGGEPSVRILLMEDVPVVRLGGADKGVLFRDASTSGDIAMLSPDEAWDAVRFSEKAQLRVAMPDGRVSRDHPSGVYAEAPGGGPVTVNGKAYRGRIYIYTMSNGNLRAINVLPLEQYLRSVVPVEIGTLDEHYMEALKAQAVVARSFALAKMQERRSSPFDMSADTGDQVYLGVAREARATDRAVEATRGEVLTYKDRVITAYYHSTCGGRTADPTEVWGEDFARTAGFLGSVEDDGFDKGSRWETWRVKWTRSQLLDQVRKYLPATVNMSASQVGEPKDIEVAEHGLSGRNARIKITTDKRSFEVRGDQIRRVLRQPDGSMLPSTMFSLSMAKEKGEVVVLAEGRGFGHGLGMCQWGARMRAEQGQSYRKILEHYYKDIKLEKKY